MSDLVVGMGLVLVIEGLLWAALPHIALQALAMASEAREQTLRICGAAAIAVGVLVVWLVRG